MKRALTIAAVLVALGIGAFTVHRGAVADRCAAELVSRAHDADWLAAHVKSPSAQKVLLSAFAVELGFVRPMSSEDVRVGLFVRTTSTATRAHVLGLLLRVATDAPDQCSFLKDYESGAFGN